MMEISADSLNQGISKSFQSDPKEKIKFEDIANIVSPMVGKWETLLSRSDSMDPIFKQLGLALYKRFVFERLAVTLKVTLQNNEFLVADMNLPFAAKRMEWRLDGSVHTENDSDFGIWKGKIEIMNTSVPSLHHVGEVKLVQQTRWNDKLGIVIEKRGIIPDDMHGRVLFFHYTYYPKNKSQPILEALRILKPV